MIKNLRLLYTKCIVSTYAGVCVCVNVHGYFNSYLLFYFTHLFASVCMYDYVMEQKNLSSLVKRFIEKKDNLVIIVLVLVLFCSSIGVGVVRPAT